MKKVIALVLAIIMMFSMTSVSYAVDNTVSTQTSSVVATNENSVSKIENYMDYLEAKLDDQNTNFFVKIIVRLVIIGVMLGIINVKDFDEWFENTAPDTDTDNSGSNPPTDSSMDKDWEDGTELTLYHTQSLPYTESIDSYENDITIKDIKITKEHYNNTYNNIIFNYKYYITINGSSSKKLQENESVGVSIGFQGETHFVPEFDGDGWQGSFTVYENNDFTITGIYYTDCDADYYTLYDLSIWHNDI